MFWTPPPRHLYLFHHVGKCAGTSLGESFGHAGEAAICLGAKTKTRTAARRLARQTLVERRLNPRRVRIFFGHRVYYGLHHLCPHPARYFTFLRHPVSRVISLYNYHCDAALDPSHPRHDKDGSIMLEAGQLIGFERWFERYYSGNHLVRFLHYAMSGESIDRPRVLDHAQVKAAKEFLARCWFIGFTERSHLDIPMVCRAVTVPTPRQHANRSRQHLEESDLPAVSDLIAEREELDMEIYETAWKMRGLSEPPSKTDAS